MYRLHYAPDKASLIVRRALEELGVEYHTVLVDRSLRVQKSAAYRALTPFALIPVLETPHGPAPAGGRACCLSVLAFRHLKRAAHRSAPALLPRALCR